MERILKKTVAVFVGLAAMLLITAFVMVFLPEPTFSKTPPDVAPPWARPGPAGFECEQSAVTQCFKMKDGVTVHATRFEAGGSTTVVLIHGVLSHGGAMERTATMLRDSLDATVLTLDLRGHGLSGGSTGDVRYIGQYEQDVAEVVAALREQAAQRIILAGHSMGGGIAMRYAATPGAPEVDGYLLFAPHLGQKSPTTRNQTAPAAAAMEPTIKVHLPRVMGLLLLNAVGISALNDRDTLYFNLPPRYPIHRYTYRAMMSMSPADYALSLRADSKPLLIVAGGNDEAFDAQYYPEVVKLHRNGRAVILDDESHQSVIQSTAAFEAIERWRNTDGR